MLASCRYTDASKVCPLIQVVATNTSICAGVGAGCLALAGLLKPRFLRLFSKISFETILALVKRAEPGTAFEITTSTKASTILAGVANGMVALDIAVLKLVELSEDTTDADVRKTLLQRLECLKTANDIQHKAPANHYAGLFGAGILTYMWAKTSEFVVTKGMQALLSGAMLLLHCPSCSLTFSTTKCGRRRRDSHVMRCVRTRKSCAALAASHPLSSALHQRAMTAVTPPAQYPPPRADRHE